MQIFAWSNLDTTILGNSLETWAYAALTLLSTVVALSWLRSKLLRRFQKAPGRAARLAQLIALLQRTHVVFFIALALYLGVQHLTLPRDAQRALEIAVQIGVWFQIGRWASALVVHLLREQLTRRGAHQLVVAGGFTVVSFIAQLLVWIAAVALALANAGVNIVVLIAGLGAGGGALALATRSILSNLFANASISLDKLFAVGDNLVTGDFQGKVEQIGNRDTRLRSVNGELLVVTNADLLNSRLRNFGRIEERRDVLIVRLPRATAAAKVRQAVTAVAGIIRDHPMARFDRCHFTQLTTDALLLEAVYYVRAGTITALAEARDNIDAQIHAVFAASQIGIEYPVQRLHLARC